MSKEAKKEVKAGAKGTWLNRICSAIVGAAIAVGSVFGITTEQVKEQKAKTEEVTKLATQALEAVKAGDVKSATEKLQSAITAGKEVVKEAKKVAENVKKADKEEVKKAVTEAVKTSVKDEKKSGKEEVKAAAEEVKTEKK